MLDARLSNVFIAVVGALCTACAATSASSGGPDWTHPSPADLEGPDAARRQSSPTAYLSSSADFDGDNREDVAKILVNRSSGKYGVFIYSGGTGTPAQVYEGSLADVNRVGVSAVPPGQYRPACAQGLGRDEGCDPSPVQLAASGLQHFTFEAGAVVFYWDGSNYVSADLTD